MVFKNQTLQKSIVILVDSKAALQSITSSNPKSKGKYLVYECLKVLKTLQEKHINVILQWIPSHIGVPGNEKVDNIAKSALHKNTIEDLKVSLPDILNHIDTRVKQSLERDWDIIKRTQKLGQIKDKWEYWPSTEISNRKLEISMARLRLGYTRLNKHMHKIGINDSPNCKYCNIPETIEHFLIHCPRYHSHRTELKRNLQMLGIKTINTNILLGGSNIDNDKKLKVVKYTQKYLKQTGKEI